MIHLNRESWLHFVAHELAPSFEQLGKPLPKNIRIAVGFTSKGKRGSRIGECWDYHCSDDGYFEIFIVPNVEHEPDLLPLKMAEILAHELVHAAVGIPEGHRKEFRRVAKGLGLDGQMRSTVAGEKFISLVNPILLKAGALPHSHLNTKEEPDQEKEETKTTSPKPQVNRHIKCKCHCGYVARTSQKWLDKLGAPFCPLHGLMQIEENSDNSSDD